MLNYNSIFMVLTSVAQPLMTLLSDPVAHTFLDCVARRQSGFFGGGKDVRL